MLQISQIKHYSWICELFELLNIVQLAAAAAELLLNPLNFRRLKIEIFNMQQQWRENSVHIFIIITTTIEYNWNWTNCWEERLIFSIFETNSDVSGEAH